ncbi:MAG: 4-(cytidine 5'-diphospho)-2-C-methyl-D-erythritol kinase [Lachnospiraceae bacterium]|nr:4-(cytidine 5'-diphospho)-2-C-methyl-D-erythritol kinase [Lachnospiraceae bacterium]
MANIEQITRKAYAKINIGLDVLRRREDGYHELKMIMQTVDICDDLVFEKAAQPGIVIQSDNEELPVDGSNLIYRAADLLMREKKITEGVKIALTKRIPIAAGMAGGSADAAATMHGVNELFGMGYSIQELQELGVKLGADIPYCLVGGTMLSEGIGEILTPLPAPPDCFLVVVKPDINVSTAFVYGNLHADRLTYHPDIDGMVEALRSGSLCGITDRLGNVLETVTIKEYPVIEQIKELLRNMGAENALMSGSGPSVFGIFTERKAVETAARAVADKQLAGQIFVSTFHSGAAE